MFILTGRREQEATMLEEPGEEKVQEDPEGEKVSFFGRKFQFLLTISVNC